MEVRVRVGIVDNAISGFGRGVRCQEFPVTEKVSMTGHLVILGDCECTALMVMIRVWPDADGVDFSSTSSSASQEKFTRTNQILQKSLFASIQLEASNSRDLRVHKIFSPEYFSLISARNLNGTGS